MFAGASWSEGPGLATALGAGVVGMAGSFVPGWGFGVMQSKLRLFLCLWAPLRSLAVERVPLWGAGTSQLGIALSLELHYSIFWLEMPTAF